MPKMRNDENHEETSIMYGNGGDSATIDNSISYTFIEGFVYVAPVKIKTIIVDSDGDINKMVGTME